MMAIALSPPKRDDGAAIVLTNTGFTFGAATVDRVCSLPRGQACIRVETPKMALNIRVTKTGKMVVTTDTGMEVLVSR